MAFPSVRSESTGIQGTNATTWTITYPSTIVAGDLLLLSVANDGDATVQATIAFFDVGKTLASGTACRLTTLFAIADGTETGTFSLFASASEQGAWRCAAYYDWYGDNDPISDSLAFSTGATGTSTTPDPDSVSPGWGAEDILWRALSASDDGRTDYTGFPTDYTLSQFSDASGGAGGASIGGATRLLNASSEDPGTFTTDRSDDWAAYTFALRPAVEVLAIPQIIIPQGLGASY